MKSLLVLLILTGAIVAVYCEIERECKATPRGHEYKGKIRHTKSGHLCQRWDAKGNDAQNEVWLIYQNEPAAYPDKSVSAAENYCRNPKTSDPQGHELGPWCYTTRHNNPRWEFCDVPDCPSCGTETKEISERAICIHGTRRLILISERARSRFHCEEEQKIYYKSCSDESQCEEPSTIIGPCNGNVREIKTTYFLKNTLTGQCKPKTEVESHICKDSVCKADKMEVMFVIDSSDSIGENNYVTLKRFIQTLALKLKQNNDGVRIGIIHYSTNVEVVAKIEENNDIRLLNDKIARMVWMKSLTATGLALNKVSEILHNQRREGVPVTVIVVTDGNSNDYKLNKYNAIKESAALKNKGVVLKVIAIGQELRIEEMNAMASHPVQDNLYKVNDFNALENWATKISKETCTDVIRPSPNLCSLKPIRIISECFRGWQSITEVEYVKLEDGSCEMMTKSSIIEQCKYVCNDPITGNQYSEGEEWTSKCHKFKCKRLNPHEPLLPIEAGCMDHKGSCRKPNSNQIFSCKDSKGNIRDNCVCTIDENMNTITMADWKI